LAEIDRLAGSSDRIRAVGETGLDHFRTGPDGHAIQEASFRAHIEMARRHGKALVIHDRDAHADVLRILDDAPLPDRVVFHCFSGDADMARYCADRGWFVSFAGPVTFANAGSLRHALAATPLARVLVETDAPFLTPHPHRGKPNGSYLVPLTVRTIADVLEQDLEAICAALQHNTDAAFGLW
jgi:TatD DNase family protein